MVYLKEQKYAEMALALDAKVVPAIMETYGAISDPLLKLFRDIANYSSTNPYALWSRHEIYNGLCLDNSLVLQKWNANILLHSERAGRW